MKQITTLLLIFALLPISPDISNGFASHRSDLRTVPGSVVLCMTQAVVPHLVSAFRKPRDGVAAAQVRSRLQKAWSPHSSNLTIVGLNTLSEDHQQVLKKALTDIPEAERSQIKVIRFVPFYRAWKLLLIGAGGMAIPDRGEMEMVVTPLLPLFRWILTHELAHLRWKASDDTQTIEESWTRGSDKPWLLRWARAELAAAWIFTFLWQMGILATCLSPEFPLFWAALIGVQGMSWLISSASPVGFVQGIKQLKNREAWILDPTKKEVPTAYATATPDETLAERYAYQQSRLGPPLTWWVMGFASFLFVSVALHAWGLLWMTENYRDAWWSITVGILQTGLEITFLLGVRKWFLKRGYGIIWKKPDTLSFVTRQLFYSAARIQRYVTSMVSVFGIGLFFLFPLHIPSAVNEGKDMLVSKTKQLATAVIRSVSPHSEVPILPSKVTAPSTSSPAPQVYRTMWKTRFRITAPEPVQKWINEAKKASAIKEVVGKPIPFTAEEKGVIELTLLPRKDSPAISSNRVVSKNYFVRQNPIIFIHGGGFNEFTNTETLKENEKKFTYRVQRGLGQIAIDHWYESDIFDAGIPVPKGWNHQHNQQLIRLNGWTLNPKYRGEILPKELRHVSNGKIQTGGRIVLEISSATPGQVILEVDYTAIQTINKSIDSAVQLPPHFTDSQSIVLQKGLPQAITIPMHRGDDVLTCFSKFRIHFGESVIGLVKRKSSGPVVPLNSQPLVLTIKVHQEYDSQNTELYYIGD